jgi:hypothetical protein
MALKVCKINNKAAKWMGMIFSLVLFIEAGVRDPFPIGSAMMSQGALVETQGASGREPWSAAAIYRDTMPWGAAFSAVSYHGADGAGGVSQYAAGGLASFGTVICKVSLMQLDAMGVYYEQTAYFSAGSIYKFLSLSAEAKSHRIGLKASSSDVRTMTSLGSTLHAQSRRISATITAEGLTVSSSGLSDVDPPLSVSGRICTVRNRYGSQGVLVKVTPINDKPIRFIVAQEYRLSPSFAIGASLGSNPTMIGFGLLVDMLPAGSSAAVVNHPLLGWSKGFYADYAGRSRK